MSEEKKAKGTESKKKEKETYDKPKVDEYGTLKELTKSAAFPFKAPSRCPNFRGLMSTHRNTSLRRRHPASRPIVSGCVILRSTTVRRGSPWPGIGPISTSVSRIWPIFTSRPLIERSNVTQNPKPRSHPFPTCF